MSPQWGQSMSFMGESILLSLHLPYDRRVQRSKLVRVLAVLALFAAPLVYGVIAYSAIAAHGSLFDDRSRRDRAELEAGLVERGMTAEQAKVVGAHEASASQAVAGYVTGVGFACVGAIVSLGMTLAVFIAAGRGASAQAGLPRG
jgi:hypothetical protein